jgi:phenylalanyl-tRNA synthetase beta chain
MKFTLTWLQDYLETDATLEEIVEKLTAIGLEVESVQDIAEQLAGFKVAKVVDAKPHPDADKLRVCRVQTGEEELQIVCGAPNARAGIYVALAPIGITVPTNGMKIKQSKIRGVESCGMMCSSAELGLGEEADGIIELDLTDADIGKEFAAFSGKDDPVIEIAITPNRGDCLGVYGIARDLAAAGLGKLKPLDTKVVSGEFTSPISVAIEDKKECPLFVGRYFKGVKNAESPQWLRTRLEAIGLRPISALVDITNYITYSFGRPLHVYDAKRISGDLTVRRAKSEEQIEALDENAYTLDDSINVVADANGAQAIAGVIGGQVSGCELDTTEVFLEVALFDAVAVAMAGRKLDIITDSRYRFERQVDPQFLLEGAAIATNMILDLCGGQASELVVSGEAPDQKPVVEFDYSEVQKRTGVAIEAAQCQAILESLGFAVDGNSVTVPSWRPDVSIKEDLVEEVVRIYGFESIPSTPLPAAEENVEPVLDGLAKRRGKMRLSLASRGMVEAITWSFMAEESARLFVEDHDLLTLKNPISSELSVMRPSLLPNLIEAVNYNAARGSANLAFFEYGRLYHGVEEKQQAPVMALLRSGNATDKSVHHDARAVDVYDIKADVYAALEAVQFPVGNLRVDTPAPSWYHPGRSGSLRLGKQVIAQFGELHPSVLKALDCDVPLVGAEIFLGNLPPQKRKSPARSKLVISEYQASQRDFAFIVDQDVQVGPVLKSVASSHKLIQDVGLFDVYQGKGVEGGKKSVAFSVKIQAADHTLTEEELEGVSKTVIGVLEKQGGTLRG